MKIGAAVSVATRGMYFGYVGRVVSVLGDLVTVDLYRSGSRAFLRRELKEI